MLKKISYIVNQEVLEITVWGRVCLIFKFLPNLKLLFAKTVAVILIVIGCYFKYLG